LSTSSVKNPKVAVHIIKGSIYFLGVKLNVKQIAVENAATAATAAAEKAKADAATAEAAEKAKADASAAAAAAAYAARNILLRNLHSMEAA
jgi:hypothetical protein